MIPHVPNQTIEHSAPCIELLTKRWLLADKPQAGDLSIKNYPSNLKFFGITCELGSHQEYLDRRHRIDSIEIGGWAIVRASVRRRAPRRSAKREYLLQKQFLAAARAAELAPQESARRSEGACGGDPKDVPDYEHPRSRRFLRDVPLRIIHLITVVNCSPARPRGASTGVGRAEAEIFLLATA